MAEAMIQVSGDDDSAWAQLWEKTQWTTHPVLFKKKCTIYYLKKTECNEVQIQLAYL